MQLPTTLILGATGRIGQILQKTWPPSPQLRWQTRRPLGHSHPGPHPGWYSFAPLTDEQVLYRAATGCKTILCLSGVTHVRAATGAPLSDNTALALAAIKAGARSGARVLLCSSAAIYGNQTTALSESAPLTPANAYGRAKADMEQAAAALAQDLGVTCCRLRIGNIAGIDSILGGWRPGFALDRFSDGRTPQRSYIGARTLAQVLADLIQAPTLPEVLNIASPGLVEMGALLDAAALTWVPRPAGPQAIARVSLDTTRLQQLSAAATLPISAEQMVAQWRYIQTDLPTKQDSQ